MSIRYCFTNHRTEKTFGRAGLRARHGIFLAGTEARPTEQLCRGSGSLLPIPRYRALQALLEVYSRLVLEHLASLANVRKRVRHVAGPSRQELYRGLHPDNGGKLLDQEIQVVPGAAAHVEDFPGNSRCTEGQL